MIPNGYLVFEDENFIESSVAKLNALRKSGQFCDVKLQVCGHEMLAHRAVLACCSPYLFEIFNNDSDPHGFSHVKFDDLNPAAVEILMNYAYTAQLKADKELVKDVYSAAKKLKMDRVRQVCGDYILSRMDVQNCISYRNFASQMGDTRLLGQIDSCIQENLLEISEQDEFLKLPRLKLEVILEENISLPSNGKVYTKVINWVQRSVWENGKNLEELMEEVQTLYYSADHKLLDGNVLDGQAEVFGIDDDHIQFVQKKSPRENSHRQIHSSSSGNLCTQVQTNKDEWKIIASEKTSCTTYLCLAVLNGVLCVIFLHGRNSPHSSPVGTPCLIKSISFEVQAEDEDDKLLPPMQYARSGLGTAELNGKLIVAGGYNREECLRTVECYDPDTDGWIFIAPMRTPRARFQMAVLMGQLYVTGGSNGHSDELCCGETYNPSTDDWTSVPELRTNRCNAGVCSLNGKLYIVGGSDPYGQKGLKNCDAFDPVSKTWTNCAPLITRRHQAAVCGLDGYLYVAGGAESWNCLNTVERYHPESNTWTLVSSMNMARRGAGVAVYDGKIFAVGGFDGTRALGCVEMFDPAKNEWKMVGSMTSARSNAGVAAVNGLLYAVGGFDGNEFLNNVEVYNPETNEWSPYTKTNMSSL
ncbi:influenza virus NS1A-binding protein homolog A isoform X1 [Carcharodon carcharias]|uniref:influenza virus NS1A-binding protein homolog A isoform X1 n=1 Tax=Carcharodon carcharias TaxID=13397 RepID=UPI001B7E2C8C|nr:influenza virus NS1A-binding protein homolog A isoform X1 [Carcharodon carcharias]XP_041064209.1 influenza virus NS1A-binding protein homolog A isoform X1 [Carcharodon carcharias]XP_041064210.1 influenza virus NS1A-binding protein homolog A isoform X1 [Carcharodon carcharias]